MDEQSQNYQKLCEYCQQQIYGHANILRHKQICIEYIKQKLEKELNPQGKNSKRGSKSSFRNLQKKGAEILKLHAIRTDSKRRRKKSELRAKLESRIIPQTNEQFAEIQEFTGSKMSAKKNLILYFKQSQAYQKLKVQLELLDMMDLLLISELLETLINTSLENSCMNCLGFCSKIQKKVTFACCLIVLQYIPFHQIQNSQLCPQLNCIEKLQALAKSQLSRMYAAATLQEFHNIHIVFNNISAFQVHNICTSNLKVLQSCLRKEVF